MSNPRSTESSRTITVLYFAAAFTATGTASEMIELPITTLSDGSASPRFPLTGLAELLSSRHPRTNLDKILETSQWSVDAEMVDDPASVFLKGGEEVAVICPVSGG